MQLHRLSFQAIGPFAGSSSIDFSEFGSSGIFLLDGPTGAGKSTIIDAIVFALYGTPAGSDASDERLRSHHVDPGTMSFVELTFETNAGIFRIHRTPSYRRVKKTGTGTTPQNATARLIKIDSVDDLDGGTIMSVSAAEVGGEVARIVGLTKKQFVQTVVLPQGEFAAFLRATGEERRGVLQSIFQTQLYDEVAQKLVVGRKAARKDAESATQLINTAVKLFVAAGGDEIEVDDFAEFEDLVALVTRCQKLVAGYEANLATKRDLRDAAVELRSQSADRHQAELRLAERLERRQSLLARQTALKDQGPAIDADATRLTLAQRAVGVRSALHAEAGTEAAAAKAALDLVGAQSDFGDDADQQTLVLMAAKIEMIVTERSTIAGLLPVEATFASREDAIATLTARVAELDSQIDTHTAAAADRPAKRSTLVASIAAARKASDDLVLANAALKQATAVSKGLERLDAMNIEDASLRAGVATRLSGASIAQQHLHDLRQRQLAGMAGELALDLTPDLPCPVCGSRQHPAPAVHDSDQPTDDDVAAADRVRIEVEAAHLAARDQLIAFQTARQHHIDELGEVSAEEAITQLATATVRVEQLAAIADTQTELDQQMVDFDAATQRLAVALTDAQLEKAACGVELKNLTHRLAEDHQTVTAALSGRAGSLAELDQILTTERVRLEALSSAVEHNTNALAERDRRREEARQAVAESGFTDVDAARAAAIDQSVMDEITARVAKHHQDLAVATAGLADPHIAALTGDEVSGVDAAAETARQAAAACTDAENIVHAAIARHIALVHRLEGLQSAIVDNNTLLERIAPIIRMADLAEASTKVNSARLTLGSFVLMRRFEEVLLAANSRLVPMSSGRYRLERSDEKESKGGNKTGLALRIFDQQTGQQREPKAFSGGETFYTSLSLALGLADVVMSEAGGIELGTLFVDEGFGSLDSETLDTVMGELGKLSESGRKVGIVSHVEELKQRVTDRITVAHNADGSSRLTLAGGDA